MVTVPAKATAGTIRTRTPKRKDWLRVRNPYSYTQDFSARDVAIGMLRLWKTLPGVHGFKTLVRLRYSA
jgi:hypothetical protein